MVNIVPSVMEKLQDVIVSAQSVTISPFMLLFVSYKALRTTDPSQQSAQPFPVQAIARMSGSVA